MRRERWQVTCGLVLIYTLVLHVASNGGAIDVIGTTSAAPTDEKVNHFYQFKYKIRTDLINILFSSRIFSTHKPCYIANSCGSIICYIGVFHIGECTDYDFMGYDAV